MGGCAEMCVRVAEVYAMVRMGVLRCVLRWIVLCSLLIFAVSIR